MITILITDANLKVVGDPITNWTAVEADKRFREPGSGKFTAPATPVLVSLLEPGNRVVLIRDGQEFISGPIEKPGPYNWSAGGSDDAEPGQIEVSFAEDLALVAARITYPNPAADAESQSATAYYAATGNAEDLMRTLVNLNAGPGALVARRVSGLTLGTDHGVGVSIKVRTRFDPLCDVLRSAAIAGGDLGFRVTPGATEIEFEVYEPRDFTNSVRFSRGIGNLRSLGYDPEAPSATVAIVGGDGTGTTRVVREVLDSGAVSRWGRLETFVNQNDTTDTTELDQAGVEALANAAEKVTLSIVAIETPLQRYGDAFELGDRVSVEYLYGLTVSDVVRAVHLDATPDSGDTLTVLVGGTDATTDPTWIAVGRAFAQRLGRLERS